MKRLLMVFALVLAGTTAANARVGLGVMGSGGLGLGNVSTWWAGISLGFGELERVNWELAVRFWGASNTFKMGVDADWHVYNHNFNEWSGFYVGVGPYVNLSYFYLAQQFGVGGPITTNTQLNFEIGARLPLGFRFFFAKHFDIWLAFVPYGGLTVQNTTSKRTNAGIGNGRESDNQIGWSAGIGLELGFRYWF